MRVYAGPRPCARPRSFSSAVEEPSGPATSTSVARCGDLAIWRCGDVETGSLFAPGAEILLPESTEEVVDILRATHPDDRRAIGAAARARILAEHTAEHRAEELEAYVTEVVAA